MPIFGNKRAGFGYLFREMPVFGNKRAGFGYLFRKMAENGNKPTENGEGGAAEGADFASISKDSHSCDFDIYEIEDSGGRTGLCNTTIGNGSSSTDRSACAVRPGDRQRIYY